MNFNKENNKYLNLNLQKFSYNWAEHQSILTDKIEVNAIIQSIVLMDLQLQIGQTVQIKL